MSRESLLAAFKKCGASFAQTAGPWIITSWKSPPSAAKCKGTMERAGLRNVTSYANPDHETTVEGELP